MAKKELSVADTYFKFPIRVMSEMDIKKIAIDEESKDAQGIEYIPERVPYAVGQFVIPYKMAKDIQWSDSFSRYRSIDMVKEEGFDCTNIVLADDTVLICHLTLKKFEKLYFDYMENVEEYFRKRDNSNSLSSFERVYEEEESEAKEEVEDGK